MQVILQVEPYFQTDTKVVRYLLYILHTAMIDLYIVQEYSKKNHTRENKPVQKKRTTFLFHAANSDNKNIFYWALFFSIDPRLL